ncbi:MAG: MerR family transcriptional regulator [Pseudobdellovibrionaceae bacterium]
MNIQTVEKITGLSKRMIRHYEDFGLISPKRGENSYRDYSVSDIEQLRGIKAMREVGFSLNEIAQILKEGKTEDVLKKHLKELLMNQQEEYKKQQDRIQTIKSVLTSAHLGSVKGNELLDRIVLAHAPSKKFDGVDDLDGFLQKHHVVHGRIAPITEMAKTANFGINKDFKIEDTTYITYRGIFEENTKQRASISLCKELYSYVILLTDDSSNFEPEFHKNILIQLSEEWRNQGFPMSFKFDALTEDIISLERLFSPFDLAVIMTARNPQGESFGIVIPGQPLVVHLSHIKGEDYNHRDWNDQGWLTKEK